MTRSELALFQVLPPNRTGHVAPFETLVDMYPNSASDRLEGKMLLEELIQYGYVDSKSLELALLKLSKDVDTFTVKGDTCLTRPSVVRAMQRVLQQVQP